MSNCKIQVGAAKLSVTPAPDMFPFPLLIVKGEYGAVRKGEELHVRAIVVDNGKDVFLFESFEMAGVPLPDILHERLGKEYGLKKENILLSATHNHSAPHVVDFGNGSHGWMKELDTDKTRAYTQFVMDQAVKVVGLAMADMRAAKYGYGEGKSYININRDQLFDDGYWMQGKNFEGCSDKTLAVIKFVDDENNLIAAILNYAMHSTMNFISKDIDGKVKATCGVPGIACNFLENYFGKGAVVMWQSGAAGNQGPLFGHGCRYDCNGTMYRNSGTQLPGSTYDTTVMVGEQHGVDALRVLKSIDANKTRADVKTAESMLQLPAQKFPEGVDRNYNHLVVDNLLVSQGYLKPGEKYEKKLVDMIPLDETVPVRAQMIIFGDIAFFGIGGELYNEIAMLCKEASPFRHTVITTHIGYPSVGYILDDDSRDRKVFQSFGRVRAGENNALIVNGMLKLFEKTLGLN